jgi:hypothetical protein
MAAKDPSLDRRTDRIVNSCSAHNRGNKQSNHPRILGKVGKNPIHSDAFYGNYRQLSLPAALHYQMATKKNDSIKRSVHENRKNL